MNYSQQVALHTQRLRTNVTVQTQQPGLQRPELVLEDGGGGLKHGHAGTESAGTVGPGSCYRRVSHALITQDRSSPGSGVSNIRKTPVPQFFVMCSGSAFTKLFFCAVALLAASQARLDGVLVPAEVLSVGRAALMFGSLTLIWTFFAGERYTPLNATRGISRTPVLSWRMICTHAAAAFYHCGGVFTVPREVKLHDE
ncbi:unnamed protein product [Tetraodon nigroviridis]|uniref:(spotted green pufferfish) hypothetical protein n=1 Tax=Tetraodon nigroviridis TaxID=99883 RepID=Q4SAB1_TETNG|nr:unnamed protein product [Tetraodon nigroviridis]